MADIKKTDEYMAKMKKDAVAGGYILNVDDDFVRMLAEGLVENGERYGIESCPCRLCEGESEDDMDIVCPCVYRDDDLAEYGACFCALYVATEEDSFVQKQVPERRPSQAERKEAKQQGVAPAGDLGYPVYRCTVCGYLCANTNPPNVCPICKASKERFERFM